MASTPDPQFVEYPKTPAFTAFKKAFCWQRNHPITDPIETDPTSVVCLPLTATFLGTVKLHGTNTTLVFRNSDTSSCQFQSRNRIISVEKDNHGCVAMLSKAPLHHLVEDVLNIRDTQETNTDARKGEFKEIAIVGEFAGRGVQSGVGISSLPLFFAIFNICLDGEWVDIRQYSSIALPDHRIFNITNFRNWEVTMQLPGDTSAVEKQMEEYTNAVGDRCPFAATFLESGQPKNMPQNGEGIVWTLVITNPPHDRTRLWNFKTKVDHFKSVNASVHLSKELDNNATEATERAKIFVGYALGTQRLEQGVEYLREMGKDAASMQNVATFMTWVSADAMLEERDEMERLEAAEKDVQKLLRHAAKKWYMERCEVEGKRT